MAEEVEDVVGPKGCHDHARVAVRHGHEDGSVTLGGRRVPVQRPRVRATDGSGEVAMSTYAHFADRDPLTKVVLEQMLAGVSTRRFFRTREPVRQDVVDAERSTSKSAVSREFVGRTGEHLRRLMARSLADVRLAVLMLDGLELKGRCCVVALGVTTDGVKVPLGLWDGSTENKRVCVELLADLVDRGLDCDQGVLVVLDGGKALRAAVDAVFGDVPLQRCIGHKECHEGQMTSAAAATLERVVVAERSARCSSLWDSTGRPGGARWCGVTPTGDHRGGLDAGRRGRSRNARRAPGP
jgi:transposase-like protein